MSRIVKAAIVQMANKLHGDESVEAHRNAMIEAHIPYIEEAGEKGVQMLCFQEIFTGPYFCPSQDVKWYDAAEVIPDGPTTQLMCEYARKYNMVIVVPVYEEHMTGVYYNTAAVVDADGTYLGKYRKNHLPQVAGFWEKFFFKPGNLGYPVFQTRYGISPGRYRDQLRIEAAENLLRKSDLLVKTIAYELGYPDTSTFSKAFHRHTGKSPLARRQETS